LVSSAEAAAESYQVIVGGRRQDTVPGIRVMSPGLL